MSDLYRITYDNEFTRQTEMLSARVESDPDSADTKLLIATLDAIDAVEWGQEAEHGGERLGFSERHYDLRDCAEIKVDVLDEHYPNGKSMGPSHRLIYREFEPTGDDPRPIRQIVAFEHRKDGLPFKVAAERLGRDKGAEYPGLAGLPNTRPAVGKQKDPNRPITPYRMPLPADVAAAVVTAPKGLPTHTRSRPPSRWTRTAAPPTRQRVRDRYPAVPES